MANLTTLTTEIADALTEERQRCALCSLWLREEASTTERVKGQATSEDAEMTERVLATSGFCNRHTHAIHRGSSTTTDADGARGRSACARIVLRKFEEGLAPLLTDLRGEKGRAESGRKVEEALTSTIRQLEKTISGSSMCPVCGSLLESDKERILSLLQMLESKEFAELYSRSDAMCMPHFVSAMRLLPASPLKDIEGVWSLLVRAELASLEKVDYLLNERMKKYSWDFRNEEITSEEANAQKTAMLAIAGVEGLYCRPRKISLRPAHQA